MKAWLFQDSRQKEKHGKDRCPWAVGWIDPDGKRRSKRVGSKSLAEKFRLKKETELEHGIASPRSMTWAKFRQEYDETILSGMGHTNRTETERALGNFQRLVKPVKLEAVSTQAVDRFRNARKREKGRKPGSTVSVATVNKELRHLRAVFNVANEWGMLAKTPKVTMLREPERDPPFVDDYTFAKLYEACESMTHPEDLPYSAAEWWRGLLTFAYLTGWRISEILDLRCSDVDLDACTAFLAAESTKGNRDVRIGLHPALIAHLRPLVANGGLVFDWPYGRRLLWSDFTALKAAAAVEFPGAFHRLRFGFANANVDNVPADVLQRLMRHKAAATTQGYVNKARRMQTLGTADRLHVPDVLRVTAAN